MEIERTEIRPLREQLDLELETARREALARQEMIEPTEDEKRNGWTKKTLTAYLAERLAGQSLAINVDTLHRKAARRQNIQNHKYNPHRWR